MIVGISVEGTKVGELDVGVAEGAADGVMLGFEDGIIEGSIVGLLDGDNVGKLLGRLVGVELGAWEGTLLGSVVGLALGVALGDNVGMQVGVFVGCNVAIHAVEAIPNVYCPFGQALHAELAPLDVNVFTGHGACSVVGAAPPTQ